MKYPRKYQVLILCPVNEPQSKVRSEDFSPHPQKEGLKSSLQTCQDFSPHPQKEGLAFLTTNLFYFSIFAKSVVRSQILYLGQLQNHTTIYRRGGVSQFGS